MRIEILLKNIRKEKRI